MRIGGVGLFLLEEEQGGSSNFYQLEFERVTEKKRKEGRGKKKGNF